MTEKPLRTIHVKVRATDASSFDRLVSYAVLEKIGRYLPRNYYIAGVADEVNEFGDSIVVINGHDDAGWTAEDYVVPRLQSGLWAAEVVR